MKSKQKTTKKAKVVPKQELFLAAYLGNFGNISESCKAAEIDRGTYYKWMKKPEFAKKFDDAVEFFNDIVEANIRDLAKSKDKDMLKFHAKMRMKHRGFIEKQQIEHSGKIANTMSFDELKSEVKKILKK